MTTTTTTEFSVRALARSIIETAADVTPAKLEAELLAAIPPEHVHDALTQMAGTFVREMIVCTRPRVVTEAPAPVVESAPATPKMKAARPRSWKVDAIRHLSAIYTGADGVTKRVRDFTRADCVFQIDELTAQAARNAAKAARWRAVDDALVEHGVEHVGDLPERVLSHLFGDDAL